MGLQRLESCKESRQVRFVKKSLFRYEIVNIASAGRIPKRNTCPIESFAFLQVERRPGILWERKSANPLLILASAEMQCPIELGC